MISFKKNIPYLVCYNLIRSSIIIFYLYIRSLFNSIEILMQAIKKIVNKLARIMLIVSWKHWLEFSDRCLYLCWGEIGISAKPHLLNHFCKWCWELSFCTKFINFVDIFDITIFKEIVSKLSNIWNTLQPRIHKASISKITQTNNSFFRLLY